ncbi:hypothetical protein E4T39_03342 [Aureobasidium subglaciale]|nr:hypothetical protein E4T39_03342 [Aureobasidium subglaciale]
MALRLCIPFNVILLGSESAAKPSSSLRPEMYSRGSPTFSAPCLRGNKKISCISCVKALPITPDAFSVLDLRWLDMISRYASYLSRNPVKIATTTVATTTINIATFRVLEHD